MWFVKKCSLHSGEMHMESSIIAMNPPVKSFLNTACTMIPKAGDTHVLTTIYIFETILSRIILGRHAREKTHLHPLKSNLTYSSECVET